MSHAGAQNVVLIADEAYVHGLAVTIQSLLHSLRAPDASTSLSTSSSSGTATTTGAAGSCSERMQLWLLDTGLTPASLGKLRSMLDTHNTTHQSGTLPAPVSVGLHIIPVTPSHITMPLPRDLDSWGTTGTNTSTQAGTTANGTTGSSSSSHDSAAVIDAAQCHHACAPPAAVCIQLPGCDGYAGRGCWLKLLVHLLLPAEVEYALYIDCDTLARQDPCCLLRAARSTFQAHPSALVAAVRDFGLPWGHAGLQAADHSSGSSSSSDSSSSSSDSSSCSSSWGQPYLNAGLLLLNLPAWRAQATEVQAQLCRWGFKFGAAAGTAAAGAAAAGTGAVVPPSAAQRQAAPGPSTPCPSGEQPAVMESRHRDRDSCDDASTPAGGEGGTTTPCAAADPVVLRYHDQDALNLMCWALKGGWVELEHRWNVQGIGTYLTDRMQPSGPNQPPLFTRQQAAALEASPAIVHFTGPPTITPAQLLNTYVKPPSKPWVLVCLNPHAAAWFAALDATPFAGWRPRQQDFEVDAVEELVRLCKALRGGGAVDRGGAVADAAGAGSSAAGQATSTSPAPYVHVCCDGGFDARSFLLGIAARCQAVAQQMSP